MRSQVLCILGAAISVAALNNGVGKLPALGYNTWNVFQCDYNETVLLAQAKSVVKHGLLKAGYEWFMLDDCYSLKNRSAKGEIIADPAKFPSGMKAFTSQLKSLGFKAGIYSDSGYKTCGGFPGSYGHEAQDLATFTSWGFTYLKYDNCYIPFDNITQENVYGRYERMRAAIEEAASTKPRSSAPPMQLALCEWGWQQPWIWASRLGQSWRSTGDIRPWWSALASIINSASFIASHTNFYGRTDLDMLEVGNVGGIGTPSGNLTFDEAKTHFTAWALLKSPLLIGTDLTQATAETVAILGNEDILRINQDPNVGEALAPFRWGGNAADWTFDARRPASYWTGNSSYGVVFMAINSEDEVKEMAFNLTESWAVRAGRVYEVYDLWSHTRNGTVAREVKVTVPAHGVSALLLSDKGPEKAGMEPYCAGWWQCTWANGTYYSN